MSAFYVLNINDVSFTIDMDLNVLDADRNFAALFDVTDIHINLAPYMNDLDISLLKDLLVKLKKHKTIHSKNFSATLSSGNNSVPFIFEIAKKNDDSFSVLMTKQSHVKNNYTNICQQNVELKSVIKNLDRYYFVYDGSKFHLKHSKEQNEIYSGDSDEFKNYIVKNFSIDLNDAVTNLQMTAMLYDIQKYKTKKTYNFSMTNNKMISVHPEMTNSETGNNLVIATIATEASTGLTENLYSQNKDGLTDMLNKKAVTEQIIHRVDVLKEPCSLIILDIDKFKDYNDTFGHAYGDKVIIAVANVIKEAVKDVGVAGRIGGDEFIIMIQSTDEQDIRNVTRNIRTGISWAITSADPSCVVTCSMGIARFPLNSGSYEELFKLADKCLYIAKNKGRNCYVIYKPEIHDSVIIKNEKIAAEKATGQIYNDDADTQLDILNLFKDPANVSIQTVLDKTRAYLGISQITLYNQQMEVEYVSGLNPDFRTPYFNDDYFKYFNSYNFLHIDNTVNFDVIDKEKHAMYRDALVASTIEYVNRDKDGNIKAIICYDVYKPARTFAKEKVVFAIMMAKILTNLL